MTRLLIAYHICAALVVAVVVLLVEHLGMPMHVLTRDPAAISRTSAALGFLSNVGVVGWSCSAAIATFTAALLWPARSANGYFGLLCALALLTWAMLVDDLFMVHERLLPRVLAGFDDTGQLYAVIVLGIAWRWRRLLSDRTRFLGATAIFWLGASAAADMLLGRLPRSLLFLIEDGSKFFGIAGWCALVVFLSVQSLRAERTLLSTVRDGTIPGADRLEAPPS